MAHHLVSWTDNGCWHLAWLMVRLPQLVLT
jgi:hypothetical protein